MEAGMTFGELASAYEALERRVAAIEEELAGMRGGGGDAVPLLDPHHGPELATGSYLPTEPKRDER